MTTKQTSAPTREDCTEVGTPDHLPTLPHSLIEIEVRQKMIAEVAYRLAEQRGFAHGHELDDWLEAEAVIDRRS
ncbi:MAG: DUF2934 domain-containing protein [Betaproteobacteria bacterium]|nr:DUF2934 domain-containing protein [Betaproteobacteria bacterium]